MYNIFALFFEMFGHSVALLLFFIALGALQHYCVQENILQGHGLPTSQTKRTILPKKTCLRSTTEDISDDDGDSFFAELGRRCDAHSS